MSEETLRFLANTGTTLSSILAAIIAFTFSARNALRGRGLSQIENLYKKAICYLLATFLMSIISFLYFSVRLLSPRCADWGGADPYFSATLFLVLPAVAIIWFVLYKKY